MADRRSDIPQWLKRWGSMSWKLLGIGLVVYFSFQAIRVVSVVALACVLALFLGAVLWPVVRFLLDRRWPPALAALSVMIGAFLVIGGLVAALMPTVVPALGTLVEDTRLAGESFRDWLKTGPLELTEAQIEGYWDTLTERLEEFGSQSFFGGATAAVEVVTGFFLLVIVTFFILKDGRRLIEMLVERVPAEHARKVHVGIRTGWRSLARYMRGLAVVGVFDAVLIGIGLWIVGVPLVLPLSILVFFGAYVPLVGAFVSGLLAVAVAFVNGGLVDAAIILGIVVAVQQIEGDIVYPIIFGQTLRLHPLIVLLGVAGGGIAFGLFGAFLAVPVIAVVLAIHEAIADDPDSSPIALARG